MFWVQTKIIISATKMDSSTDMEKVDYKFYGVRQSNANCVDPEQAAREIERAEPNKLRSTI